MAESFVEEGVARVRTVVKRADRRIQKAQKQIESRRKSFEKELGSRSRRLQQRAQKELSRLVTRAQKLPLVKRLEGLADGASDRLEAGMESVLGALQIPSRGDIQRIDRKLNQLAKKLREIEKGQEAEA